MEKPATYLPQQMTSDEFSLENANHLQDLPPYTYSRFLHIYVCTDLRQIPLAKKTKEKQRLCAHAPPGEILKPTDLSGNISTVSERLQN